MSSSTKARRPRKPRLGERRPALGPGYSFVVSALAGANGQNDGDGALTELGYALDRQLRGDEGAEQFGQWVVAHSDSPADVDTPPRRLLMPSCLTIGGMHENPAVVHPLHVRPVEAGMSPVEDQHPTGNQHPHG